MKKKLGGITGIVVLLTLVIFTIAGCGDGENGDPSSPSGGNNYWELWANQYKNGYTEGWPETLLSNDYQVILQNPGTQCFYREDVMGGDNELNIYCSHITYTMFESLVQQVTGDSRWELRSSSTNLYSWQIIDWENVYDLWIWFYENSPVQSGTNILYPPSGEGSMRIWAVN